MKTQMLTAAVWAGVLVLSACGGEQDADVGGYDTVEPSAAEPTATTAPPAEMEPDTIGMDTMMPASPTDTLSR